MLVRKGTYKDFIAQFYGANLVVNIKDQSRSLLFFLMRVTKERMRFAGKRLRWYKLNIAMVQLKECDAF